MIAAAMCGTMPSVQPNAATMLAREPRDRPVAKVNSTPVPGEITTISDVSRKSRLMTFPYLAALLGSNADIFAGFEIARTPIADGRDHRDEAAALARQPILDLGRHHAVVLALDKAGLDQRLQLAAQHAWRDGWAA